jgi:nonribosomal peptide synthetase DhbF
MVGAGESGLVDGLEILGEEERRQVLYGWNQTERALPAVGCVHELFEEQVKRAPEAVAVVSEDRALSYGELNRRANQLAHYLRELGVRPDVCVGICAERGLEMIAGMLAIMKAGGAYVPLDPAYPTERLRYMLQDSAPAVLLTQGESGGWWRDINGAMPVVNLGPGVGAWNSYPESNPKVDSVGVTARHVAYVIYTSGSTGQPKGVCVEHRGIVRLVRNTNYIQIGPEDAIAQASNVSFDAAIFEIWSALSNGARMVNIGRNVLLSPVQLEQELQRNQVTILLLTTALFNQMARDGVEMFSQLRYLLFGGEQVEPRSVTRVLLEGMPEHLLHMYGPSETVTFATWEEVTRVEAERTIPIGRPIANTRAYIVDGSGEPVPVGVVGELCIGGIGVARGYLKQPELTAERFVEDPYAEEAGARMYKTGDLARWRADGSIEFIGRNDEQVKIRGFRIELGEIESKLAEHAGVRDVLVVVRPGAESEKYLVAYYVAGEDQNNEGTVGSEALRRYLAERLPEYMVPSAYVMLEKIPLTANGKVDRKALPVPGMGAYAAKSYEPPQGEVETKLAQLWAEVLQLEQVGRHDNFFERGGHSLLVVRFMMRVRQELGVEMAIEEMFARPVLADLARHLEKAVEEVGGRLGQARRPVERMVRPAEIPLSFAQQRLWFLNQMEGSSASYNIPVALGLKGELNSRALEAALGDLLQRHESLRTVFPERMGIPRQHILDARATGFRLEIVLSSAAGMREDVAAAAATTFDLSREISLRAYLFVLSPRENVLLLLLHHIAADLWSTAPLWRDLDVAYRARSRGRAPEWSDLPVQYADYALWQREVLGSEEDPESVIAQQVAYWKETLKDLPEQIELPVDRVRPAIASYRGGGVQIHVSEATHAGLLQLAGQEQATLFMVLQAGLVGLLSRLGAGTDIALGSPIAGRPDIALEELVGFFINTLVLRTEAGGNPTLVELLGRVRRADLSAYAHQDVPFERLVEQLNPVRSLSRQPLFQVMFTILASEYGEVKLGELEVRSEGVSTTTAKFDLLFGLWEVRGSNGEPQGLAGNIEYAMDLFEHGTVERIGKQLVRVLEAMAENPGQRIGKIDLLEESERRQLLWEWNETKHAEGMRTAVERFEEQVERGPMAIAVRCGGEAVSYGELNERANRVAHLLLGRGVGIDDVVGVALPRSVAMVTALLGVLKSGAGYLPLDIEYPEERLRYVVEETKPEGIITSVEAGKKLPGERKQIVLDATGTQAELAGSPTHNPARRPGEDHLSHVIYTSGSTGRPKGVAVRHGSVSVLLDWMKEEYSGRELSVVLASTAISFDISVFEIFGTLSCGGTIVLVNNALEGSEEIIEAGVTLINTVPSVMNALLERKGVPGSVLTVNLAGEALHTRMVWRLYEETGVERVLNLYGPSEDTTFSTVALISRQEEREDAPIGKPLWNTQVYVLDGEMEATPRGVVGELYIGGAGLARGYEKRGELTGERFVPNPYGEMGSRLYRTGDLVKWREDGNLEFVGRRDEQVKIRGLRVELGEIEAALLRDEKVGQAVAMVREDRPGERRLVGYVVARPGEKVEKEELRRGLGKSLPEYMVPGVLVELDEMPFTANGKVNRRGLPAPEVKAREWREPKTAQEQMLCSLIAATLGTGRVGLDDNFFELGGDSIKSIQLVSRARNLGVMLTPRDVFRYATIEQLAAAIESYEGEQLPTVIRDLSKEAVLDPKIVPVSQAPAARSAAGILLTGASGFLGCFLLVELLNRTQATVYCLVRSSTREEGMARIVAKLKSYGLWQETFLSRIVAVPGDMAKTMLDLSRQQFEKLAEAIDAIYHCAAMVNVVYSYDIMKATNVRGTEEILRLACLGRTKPLHYISTLSVIPPLSETEQAESMTEEELFEKWQNLPSGYTQSKWVAEKLVRIARSRGVPVSIYRPSFISGSMQSGMTNPNDFVSRFISACLELGCVPDADMEINMTPVDHISRAIVALSMREDMQGRCLNVVNAKPVRLSMLSECLLSLGHPSGLPMQKVSYSSWWSQCVASAELKDLRNFFPEPVRKPVPKGRVNTTEVKIDFDSAARLLQEDGIHFPAMTPELLKSYITYLRRDVVRKQKLVFERASAD